MECVSQVVVWEQLVHVQVVVGAKKVELGVAGGTRPGSCANEDGQMSQ